MDSDLSGELSSWMAPGIEDLLLESAGETEVLEEVLSRVEDLRWEEDLCLSFRSERSFLEASFLSRLLSGLLSRTLEGMAGDWHDAERRVLSERLLCRSHLPTEADLVAAPAGRLQGLPQQRSLGFEGVSSSWYREVDERVTPEIGEIRATRNKEQG